MRPTPSNYLLNDAGIDYLGDLTFEDGSPLYRAKELQHMEDVKIVMQAALRDSYRRGESGAGGDGRRSWHGGAKPAGRCGAGYRRAACSRLL